MNENANNPKEVAAVTRVRCRGIEYNYDGSCLKVALDAFHERVDAIVTTFDNGTTRVSCVCFDRDKEGLPICRATRGMPFRSETGEIGDCPRCVFAHDSPNQKENNLSSYSTSNEDEADDDEEAEHSDQEEDYQPPEDYVQES